MKSRRRVITLSLSLRALPIVALFAWAQGGEKPLPDVRLLIQDVVAHEQLALAAQREYVVVEEDGLVGHKGDCVDDPVGWLVAAHGGYCSATSESHHRYEILWLDGVRVSRLLHGYSWKGGKDIHGADLSPEELRTEQAQIDKDVAEARLHKDGQPAAANAENALPITMVRILELGDYSHASREMAKGRIVIVLDYKGNPPTDTTNPLEMALKQFIGTVTIDEEDRALVRFEGYFANEVKVSGSRRLFIHQYADLQLENVRMGDGQWFPGCANLFGIVDYGDFKLKGGARIEFYDYRKFRVSTRIEGTAESVPDEAPEAQPEPDKRFRPRCLLHVNVRSTNTNSGVMK